MNLLSGIYLELPEDELPSLDSDMQITFRYSPAPIPNGFLCAPDAHRSSCILAWFYPPYSHCSISTVPFLPGLGKTQLSGTLDTSIETHCRASSETSRVYRSSLKKPSPRLSHLQLKPLVPLKVGPGNFP